MAKKRLTDPGKWGKKFLRELPSAYKLLWLYLKDVCDYAGVWEVDMAVAVVQTGEQVETEKALELFGDRVVVSADGLKWWIPEFIDEQYGKLTDSNNVYHRVMGVLISCGFSYGEAPPKPLRSPSEGGEKSPSEGATKEVINNNNISITTSIDNTVLNNTSNINIDAVAPPKELTSPLQGGEQKITGNVSAYSNVKTGSEVLPLADCLGAFMVSNVCGMVRDLIIKRLHDLSNKVLLKEIGDMALLNEWGLRFNETLAGRLMKSRSLTEWSSHFQNWLNKQDLSTNPKELYNGKSGPNNGTQKRAAIAAGNLTDERAGFWKK